MRRIEGAETTARKKIDIEALKRSIPIGQFFRSHLREAPHQNGGKSRTFFCSFHRDEQHPNLSVNPETGSWKCWACGASGGDVIDFYMKLKSLRFKETVRELAQQYAPELLPEERKKPAKRPGITLKELAEDKGFSVEYLREEFGLHDMENQNCAGTLYGKCVGIPYRDEAGQVVHIKRRTALAAKEGSFWPSGTALMAYGLDGLAAARERGYLVFPEGESDSWTLHYYKIPCLGIPGSGGASALKAEHLQGIEKVYIHREPGKGGEEFAAGMTRRLKELGFQGPVLVFSLPGIKDPNELHQKRPDEFREVFQAALDGAKAVDLYPRILPTAELVRAVAELLSRHLVFKDQRFPLLIALWVLGTYLHEAFTYYGYLWVTSPVKRCGKSRLVDILVHLCCKATPRISNASESTLFRLANQGHTLMLDEIENLRREDKENFGAIMTILNNGFQAGGTVPRSEKVGDKFETVFFQVYCPKVLAGIASVVDTIADRSFKIPMARKAPDEKVERFNLRRQRKTLEEWKGQMETWAEAQRERITTLYDNLDEVNALSDLDDRFQDISEPLAVIASLADAEAQAEGGILSVLTDLLHDMAGKRSEEERKEGIAAFIPLAEEILEQAEETFISSVELLARVKDLDELSWIASTARLSRFLGGFDLSPRRDSGGRKRGYIISREWVSDLKKRYSFPLPQFKVSEVSESQY